jgi:glutathione S-transferase
MAKAKLTLGSKNYGSWSMRGWLLCRLAGLDFYEVTIPSDDAAFCAELLPTDRAARAHCRAISGEMHSGFANLRSALPMNLKGDYPDFKVWAGAQADLDRVFTIWRDCIAQSSGPFLFGKQPCLADVMYAPVCTRLVTYHVKLDDIATKYCRTVLSHPAVKEWIADAKAEPEELEELEVEF